MTIPANTREAPMESDRELLELAARAAGIEGAYFHSDNPIHCGIYQARGEYYWNPLISDSEAFRLAVKLGITPTVVLSKRYAVATIRETGMSCREDFRSPDDSALGATRRAIVRAAAAIARSQHE